MGYTKGYLIRYIDSIRFIPDSMHTLVNNISGKMHDQQCQYGSTFEDCEKCEECKSNGLKRCKNVKNGKNYQLC